MSFNQENIGYLLEDRSSFYWSVGNIRLNFVKRFDTHIGFMDRHPLVQEEGERACREGLAGGGLREVPKVQSCPMSDVLCSSIKHQT